MRMTTETTSYGEWPSPIDGADVARKQVGLAFPVIDAAGVWWQESRPEEGGRVAVVRQGPDGVHRDLLPMPYNARTRVHEYGGQSYQPVPGGFVFANFATSGCTAAGDGGGDSDPEPLTPAPGGYLVPVRRLRPVPGRGRGLVRAGTAPAARRPDHPRDRGRPAGRLGRRRPRAMRVLASGSDFYAFPAPSPDGTRLAWICWDHPLMPWDGTELRVAALDGAGPVSDRPSSSYSWAARPSRCSPRRGGTTAACT